MISQESTTKDIKLVDHEGRQTALSSSVQCEKVIFSQESNLQFLDYRSSAQPFGPDFFHKHHFLEQWTRNPKAGDSIPAVRQLFAMLVFK